MGLSPLCCIMVCSNESPGYDPLQHRPGNKASYWPAGDEAFLWPVSIPGGCVRACVCVRVLLRQYSAQYWGTLSGIHSGTAHFTLLTPSFLCPHTPHSGGRAEEERRRGILCCLLTLVQLRQPYKTWFDHEIRPAGASRWYWSNTVIFQQSKHICDKVTLST